MATKSIITADLSICYLCQKWWGFDTPATEVHHCMHGWANRKLADKYGLVVGLCSRHHNDQSSGMAAHFNADVDEELKRDAQTAFEKRHGHDRWMELFGTNWR